MRPVTFQLIINFFMNKGILIKAAIVLIVAAIAHSVFWFFKVGQVEKQINKFITENSAYISAGEIKISGFPLSQKLVIKDLKFSIPSHLLDKRQTMIKQLEASAKIFSSDFAVTAVDSVTTQDIEGNVANVEFTKRPEIGISFADGRITKFNYRDFGYRILDSEKSVIYAASGSTIALESSVGEGDKVITKLSANVKDIEGFSIIDAYKNALEKKITDGLKTGEIAIGNSPSPLAQDMVQLNVAKVDSKATNSSQTNTTAESAPVQSPQASNTAPRNTAPSSAAQNPSPVSSNIPAIISDGGTVKSNLVLDVEIVLVPNHSEQQPQIPTDPTQIQEVPLQYSRVTKVNNLEFSNHLYKILVNGEVRILPDDTLPSGSLSAKVEKIDNLISQVSAGFMQMSDKTKAATGLQSADLSGTGIPVEDSYQNFLKRISANLSSVAKELASKNVVTKEDIAQFDFRREKNLDLLINETPVREVLGKF